MDEEDDTSLRERGFDASSTRFQSRDKGTIVKSKRKFGIEIEMLHESRSTLNKLARSISTAFGIEHDGSLDGGRTHHGVEVVTPILQGGLGETAVKDLFLTINKLKFSVNKTCGLHVHLDGKDFAKADKILVSPIEVVQEKTILNLKDDDYSFVIREDVMKAITSKTGMQTDEVARIIADEQLTTDSSHLFLSKTLGQNIPEIVVRDGVLRLGDTKTMIDVFCLTDETLRMDQIDGYVIEGCKPTANDYFCTVYNNKNLKNVLTLLYLHTVFGDVFMSMLPKSRRSQNLYCQDLSLGFSAGQIEGIQTYGELENAWYKTKTTDEVRRRKGNRYDDSRYFTVNLHSLFAKYGTIEIRSHSATLDPNKALYWVALHQEILDKIVAGEITIEALRQGSHLFHVEQKIDFLMSVMNLRTPLQKYMQQRIDYFKTNETK